MDWATDQIHINCVCRLVCLSIYQPINIDHTTLSGCCWTFTPVLCFYTCSGWRRTGVCMFVAFWSLQLWLDAGGPICAGAVPSGWEDGSERPREEVHFVTTTEYETAQEQHFVHGNSKDHSHMPFGAPGCRGAIAWEFPPPDNIRLGMAWPEGWGRAKM